jgi:hypothetical protein
VSVKEVVAVSDVFGDLQNWRGVLSTLDDLSADGRLDGHQDGLARLVRCRENPRLQMAAVESALQIGTSFDLLVADTLNAVACRESSLALRVAAARATGHLLSHYAPSGFSQFDLQRAFQTLQHMAAREQPPPLAQALQEALDQARPHIVGGNDT